MTCVHLYANAWTGTGYKKLWVLICDVSLSFFLYWNHGYLKSHDMSQNIKQKNTEEINCPCLCLDCWVTPFPKKWFINPPSWDNVGSNRGLI